MIYLLILFFIFILAFLDVSDDAVFPKYKNTLLIFCFMLMFIIAGFRYQVGYDFNSYERIYNNITLSNFRGNNLEIGFSLFVCLLKKIGLGFPVMIMLIAMASIFIKYKVIREYSVYPFISLLVYFSANFIIQDFGQIRQGLAIAFTLYSIKYIKDKKLFKYLIVMMMAIMFHYSAVLFLPMYWLARINVNKKVIATALIVSGVFFVCSKSGVIDYVVLKVINQPYISYKYVAYMSSAGGIGIFKLTFLSRLVIFTLFYVLRGKIKENCECYNILSMAYLISIFMYVAFNFNGALATRGALYFKIVEILIIPQIIYAVKDKIIMFNGLMILYLFTFKDLYFEIMSSSDRFMPYRNLISEFLRNVFS